MTCSRTGQLACRPPSSRRWPSAPPSNSQGISGGARNRHAASSVAPICLHIGAPCVLAWRPRSLARNARPLLAGALMAERVPDLAWTEQAFADLTKEFGDVYGGRTVLVTGADGFMGSHLTDALVHLGADVHAFVRAT